MLAVDRQDPSMNDSAICISPESSLLIVAESGSLSLSAEPFIRLGMNRSVEECNRRLLRARDAMDRTFAEPLLIRKLARIAKVSEAHFIRTFASTFGETPHRYLQRRRIERAMFLLRASNRSITDICLDVGFAAWAHSVGLSRMWWENRLQVSAKEDDWAQYRHAS